MAAAMPQWREMLQRSLKKNKSLAYSRYVQLATVRPDGRPANRTVVFRGFLDGSAADNDDVTFVTDKRSSKVAEVAANPSAEVAWYFPVTREQYRLSGALRIVTDDDAAAGAPLAAARQKAWASMSDAGRAQFMWPHPGLPRLRGTAEDEAAFLAPAPGGGGEPARAFCLVVMRVDAVDYINLRQNRRVAFERDGAAADGAGAAAAAVGGDGGGGGAGDGSSDGGGGGDESGEVPADPARSSCGWRATEVNP